MPRPGGSSATTKTATVVTKPRKQYTGTELQNALTFVENGQETRTAELSMKLQVNGIKVEGDVVALFCEPTAALRKLYPLGPIVVEAKVSAGSIDAFLTLEDLYSQMAKAANMEYVFVMVKGYADKAVLTPAQAKSFFQVQRFIEAVPTKDGKVWNKAAKKYNAVLVPQFDRVSVEQVWGKRTEMLLCVETLSAATSEAGLERLAKMKEAQTQITEQKRAFFADKENRRRKTSAASKEAIEEVEEVKGQDTTSNRRKR